MMDQDRQNSLLKQLAQGLPLCERPYLALAEELGVSEHEVIAFIQAALEQKLIKRLGMVVNHHQVGYVANAMVVWDIPDPEVDAVAERLAAQAKINLCYQRPRRLPTWPYNLFTMVHGKNRDEVLAELSQITEQTQTAHYAREILFSTRKFKQTGARFHG